MVFIKMRKRCCFSVIGISIILAGIGVGLYFILKPKTVDPIVEDSSCEVETPPKSIDEILKHTDLKGLLQLSEINKNFSDLAVVAFKQNYAEQRIRIGLGELGNLHKYVWETDAILKTLKLFGSGIKLMDFYCYGILDDRYKRVIQRLINNCSCSSLQAFAMYECSGNVWEDITRPFKEVRIFSYMIQSGDMGNDFKPFNDLFPKLMSLTIPNFMARDGSHVDGKFPNLLQLTLLRRYQFPEMGSSFEKVIRENPQILHLAAMNLTSSFLKFAGQNLPNLRELHLTLLEKGSEIMEFPNVKKLTCVRVAAENLKLPKLEELNIRFNDMNRESCMKFIHNHPNINVFILASGSDLDNQIFSELVGNLPNVVDLTIDDGNRILPENIINFMENHMKIQKLNLGYCVDRAYELLKEKLKDKWIFEDYKNCLTFSRKI